MNQFYFALFCFFGYQATAQSNSIHSDSSFGITNYQKDLKQKSNPLRLWMIGGTSVVAYGSSLIYLNEAWYKGYDRTSFHTFNDAGEWLQMDKAGHAWTAYNTSRAATALWKWAGISPQKAVIIGSLSGFSYLTIIEWLDGYSSKWGWSWPDIAANGAGSSLFAVQEFLWQEQRIQYKYSAHRKRYQPDLKSRADQLFGNNLPERLLKDYNAQTLWLSFHVKSFIPRSNVPSWLNLSIGYGAEGLYGGVENRGFDKDGQITFNRLDIRRYRQWYLSPDIDFTKIKSNKKIVRTLLAFLNTIKVPAPAIEFSKGKLKGRIISF